MSTRLTVRQAVERARLHFVQRARGSRPAVEILSAVHDADRHVYLIQCAEGPADHLMRAHELWVSESTGAITDARRYGAQDGH